ncbi:MAG TPA: DUF4440 domain-containing protein [Thermoanaerobaculia bacterium]|nr:DUF4440 domain-containing protein [Thermoanaerobaculia bacterium]
MKTLLVASLVICAAAASAETYEMTTYYVAFLYRGAKWTAQETAETRKIQEDHMANIQRMHDAGKLVVAGPFADDGDLRGLFLFQGLTREEAERLAANDPAVVAGRLRIELHPWFAAKGIRVDPPTVPQEPTVTLPPDLARVLTDYEAGWRNGDGAALASLFTEDGFVLPNGNPPVRGRGAIREYYKGPGGPLVLRALAFATDGPVGYIIGGFARQQGQPDVGKFTLTLRKNSDGRWLIVSDMDNGNRRQPTN